MNDWVVPRLNWDDTYRPDRGRCSMRSKLETAAKFQRYIAEDENHVAARTLPGRQPKGAYLHARLRPQQVRRLYRNAGRIPGSDGPPAAETQGGRELRARARIIAAPTTRSFGVITLGRLRSGRSRSARHPGSDGHRRRLHAHPRLSLRRNVSKHFSSSTSSASSSSRTATPSFVRC